MLLALKVGVIWRTWVHPKGNFLGFLFYFVFKVRLQRNLNFKCSITFLLNDCSYLCQVNAPIQGEAILIPLQAGPLMKRRLKFLLRGIAHDECLLSYSLSQAHLSGLCTKLYRRLFELISKECPLMGINSIKYRTGVQRAARETAHLVSWWHLPLL